MADYGFGNESVPDAPDTGVQEQKANSVYDTATSNAGQTFNTAQAYNQTAHDQLQGLVGQEAPMLQRINNTAGQNLQTYGSTFVPLQAQQAQQAQAYGSDQNVQQLKGEAVADSNAAQQAARSNSAAKLASEGVDPASIHGGALDRQAAVTNAAQNAGVATQSGLQTQATARNLVAGANQLGLQVGQAGTSGAVAGEQVGSGTQQAINATGSTAVGNLQGANTYLNTGLNANSQANAITQQQYQDQFNNAAQATKNHAAAANALTSWMDKGGVVPSEGALPVSPIPGSTDTKPAFLTPGEFVIPKDVVEHKGQGFFHKLIDSTRVETQKRRPNPSPVQPHVSSH